LRPNFSKRFLILFYYIFNDKIVQYLITLGPEVKTLGNILNASLFIERFLMLPSVWYMALWFGRSPHDKQNKQPSTLINGCGKLVLDYESVNEAFFSSLHHRLLLID
jgi:hypothetical protein